MVSIVDAHVGSRVRRTREFRGVALSELAGALGVPAWQLDLFERGGARMPALDLILAGRRLKVDPSFFLQGALGQGRGASLETQRVASPAGADPRVVAFIVARRGGAGRRGRPRSLA